MPFKKSTKRVRKVAKKRTTYRKRYTRKPMYKISSYPLPSVTIRRLKYVTQFSINSAVGVAGNYTFSANGLYDPDISGVGHQPYGFDQLMAMYNHYTVLGAKITITGATSSEQNAVGLIIKLDADGNFSTSDPALLLEQPGLKRKLNSNFNTQLRMSQTFSAKKFFGSKVIKGVYDANLSGDSSSNPIDQAYFCVGVIPFTSLQDLSSIPFYAEIEYIAKFFEPKELPSS